MVDSARQLLDELMGRNRNLDPTIKGKQLNWEDQEVTFDIFIVYLENELNISFKL